jgi:uncharacterized protein YbjT (DUF2867 family)
MVPISRESGVTDRQGKTIVICGATGRQGGAVARHMIADGWHVKGLTRDPDTEKARKLGNSGAELVRADMADRGELERAFAGAYGVFSVQNPMISGFESEVEQGRNVAEAAKAAGIKHVVYGAAGIGRRTGIPSWDTKVEIEERMEALDLPLTVLRPNAFMELLTDKAYYPPVAIWHVMVKLMGGSRNVPWLAADDVGEIAARAFEQPDRFVGRQIPLAADIKTLDESRAVWTEVFGKPPSKFPLPVWLFERISGHAGKDLPKMWRWLRRNEIPEDTAPTRDIHPAALTLQEWLQQKRVERSAGL